MNVPIGANAAALASDIGVILSKISPLRVKKWKDVPKSQRITFFESKFFGH